MTTTTTDNRYYVKSGYCYGESNERSCVLSGNDCMSGNGWISALEMLDWAGPGQECPRQDTLRALPVGTCNNGDDSNNLCAPNAESCENPDSFIKNSDSDPSSSCRLDETLFGSCGNDGNGEPVCRYRPFDCPENKASSIWTFPDDRCTCDKVSVGACRHNVHTDVLVCAVDEQACDEQISTWIPVHHLAVETGGSSNTGGVRECFLCRPQNTATVVATPTPPQEDEDPSPLQDNNGAATDKNSTVNNSSNNGNKEIIILGTSIGGTVLLAMVASWWLIWRRRRATRASTKGSNKSASSQGGLTAPTNVIIDATKREGDDAEDDISVL